MSMALSPRLICWKTTKLDDKTLGPKRSHPNESKKIKKPKVDEEVAVENKMPFIWAKCNDQTAEVTQKCHLVRESLPKIPDHSFRLCKVLCLDSFQKALRYLIS